MGTFRKYTNGTPRQVLIFGNKCRTQENISERSVHATATGRKKLIPIVAKTTTR